MRDTFAQEIGLELIGSVVGACVGAFTGFYLLWLLLVSWTLHHGMEVCGYGAVFLGAPVGSLVAISLVEKTIRKFHRCTFGAVIFALVACDLAILLVQVILPDSALAAEPEHLALTAGVFAFLGYKASGLGTARSKRELTLQAQQPGNTAGGQVR